MDANLGNDQRRDHSNKTPGSPDPSKVSFTAKFVAHGRAKTDIPFADEVASLIGAEQVYQEMVTAAGDEAADLDWFSVMLEARYKSLSQGLKRTGIKQVLEFASGVALRGLAQSRDPAITYVETDLPGMTAEKVAIVNKIRAKHGIAEPNNLFFHSLNILVWHEVEEALAHFSPDEPVAILHEGLFPYLSLTEKTIAAQNIHRILQRFGGVWLTPDFHAYGDIVSDLWLSGPMARVSKAISAVTERDFDERTFEAEANIHDFCRSNGFKMEIHPQIDDSFELTSLKTAKISPARLETLRQHLRLFQMSIA